MSNNTFKLQDVVSFYSTVLIDGGEIRKAFVTAVHPPEEWVSAGFGIPKIIISTDPLSDDEIGRSLDEMAQQNAHRLFEQFEFEKTGESE
jgi:hypothetical protein